MPKRLLARHRTLDCARFLPLLVAVQSLLSLQSFDAKLFPAAMICPLPPHVVSGADLGTRFIFCDKKKITARGGGPGRFPRLFVAADIVWGYWARVGSFSDRFRVFFMHKSPPSSPIRPPPAFPRSHTPARYREPKFTKNPAKLPNHVICTLAPPESCQSSSVGTARLLLG